MNRKITTGLLALTVAAGTLAACDDNGSSSYDTMCVNYFTGVFEPYAYCAPGYYGFGTRYRTYYLPAGSSVPPVGQRLPHYSRSRFTRPSGASIHTGGVPTKGGKAPKITPPKAKTSGGGGVNLKKSNGSGSKPKPAAPRPASNGGHR